MYICIWIHVIDLQMLPIGLRE